MLTCRSCGSVDLTVVLSLGSMPLANALLSTDQEGETEQVYPLDLAICLTCSLVQITETVDPVILFREYVYRSSYSDTMLEHARTLVSRVIAERRLGQGHQVLEVASNDGYLLQHYARADIPVLGVEPAENIARIARDESGIPTLAEFFGREVAERLRAEWGMADVVHAHNVLAHATHLNDFVAGLEAILAPTGVIIIEVPYVADLVDRTEFDTIYHEHLCYFSLTALSRLLKRHRLCVVNVERVSIHGGSLRLFVAHEQFATGERGNLGQESSGVERLLAEEAAQGVALAITMHLTDEHAGSVLRYYREFACRVESVRRDLVALLRRLKGEGRSIAAYGASAKGSTLLNFCGIGRNEIDYVVDRSVLKQGRFTPGTHLPIYPPERLIETMPDFVLLLTWNFADEIRHQQAEYVRRGGKFVVPIPKVAVV